MLLGKVSRFVKTLLANKVFRSDDELYVYLILLVGLVFAALTQLGLLIIFTVEGIVLMVLLNAAMLLAHLGAAMLVHFRRKYVLAGFGLSLLVTAYGTGASFLTGFDTYNIFYMVLVIMLQFVIPYAGRVGRGIVIAISMVCTFAVTVLKFSITPYYDLGHIQMVLALYNVFIGLIGIGIELTIMSTVKSVIAGQAAYKLDEMTDQANSDSLTGLYNRRYAHMFFDNLKRGHSEEVWCVAMLDVDNFKKLNDVYGHQAGDSVLSCVAGTMRQTLRGSDVIFRWGGEEFLIILKGTRLEDAVRVLDKLRYNIESSTYTAAGQELRITATIGVTRLDITDIDVSLEECDALMYEGKRSGKNKVVAQSAIPARA